MNMANGKATVNGGPAALREDNRLRVEDTAAHDWYRFVLSFPPHLARDYVERFGISSVGVEANPIACFATRVKDDCNLNSHDLLSQHVCDCGAGLPKARNAGHLQRPRQQNSRKCSTPGVV